MQSGPTGVTGPRLRPSLAPDVHLEYIMRADRLLLLVLLSGLASQAADVCNPADLVGPYAFQLTGSTDISGTSRPLPAWAGSTSMGVAV